MYNKYSVDDVNNLSEQTSLQLPSIDTIQDHNIPIIGNYTLNIKQQYQSIPKIQGSIRLIEKKYKQNLKQGFDNKIKAFRIQAVIQRKILQQKLLDVSRTMQHQARQQKYSRAKRQHQQQLQFMYEIRQQKAQKARIIQSKFDEERRQLSLTFKDRIEKHEEFKKQLHNKILMEHELNCKKKQYFQTIKQLMLKKELDCQKRQQIDKIIQKSKILQQCKEELRSLSQKQSNASFLTL